MKKPLAIWITDLHLSPNTIDVVMRIVIQVVELCQQIQDPVVIIGGDVFNSRAGQPQSVLSAFSDILNTFYENGIKVICIPGNHDKVDYTSRESYLDPYDGREGFTLYRSCAALNASEYGMKFHFIPYFDERLTYPEYLKQANLDLSVKNILFTHVAISGVRNNDGSKVENELSVNLFHHFHKVIVGHYHNRQIFDNIIYTGSVYQANFGEDSIKGCTVIYTDGSQQFVQLQFPEYRTHLVSLTQLSSLGTSNWDQENNHRIKLSGKPDLQQAKIIQQLEAKGIKVEYEYEQLIHADQNDVRSEFSNEDILAYFEEWCNVEQIQDKEFGLKQLQV